MDILARTRSLVGTSPEWVADDIICGDGEVVFERVNPSTVRAKVGNGSLPFSALPYLQASPSLNPPLMYRGTRDFTQPAPTAALNGDAWANTTNGVAHGTWAGIAGAAVVQFDTYAYNGTVWQLIGSSAGIDAAIRADLANGADVGKGDALITVNNGAVGEVPHSLHFWIKASARNLCNFLTTAEVDDILSRTGAIDISAKFNAALAASAGKFLELPEGKMRAGSLVIAGDNTTVHGKGNASVIIAPSATEDVFSVDGSFCEMHDLSIFAGVTRTGGSYVNIRPPSAGRFLLNGFYFDGFLDGIHIDAAATITLQNGKLFNGIAAQSVGVRVNSGFDVTVRDIVLDAAANIFAGILVVATGDLTIEDCNLIHAGQALLLNPGAGDAITSVWANNCFFDSSYRGLYIKADGGNVARCIFDQCWFASAVQHGVLVQTSAGGTVKGLHFDGCQFFINGAEGMLIADSGTSDVHITGGAAAGNNGAGVHFAAGVSQSSIIGLRSGNCDGFAGNVQGILIDPGASNNVIIVGNILSGNSSSPLTDGGTGTGRLVHSNPDWGVGRVSYDPAALANGAGITLTVPCFGASMGDHAMVSFDQDLQGVIVTAWVSSASVVSVRVQNQTGASVDLAPGTIRATVLRAA